MGLKLLVIVFNILFHLKYIHQIKYVLNIYVVSILILKILHDILCSIHKFLRVIIYFFVMYLCNLHNL